MVCACFGGGIIENVRLRKRALEDHQEINELKERSINQPQLKNRFQIFVRHVSETRGGIRANVVELTCDLEQSFESA